MSLAETLTTFQASASQCDRLIANAHREDPGGVPVLPALDQRQITVAAFLNLFVAWETFLEESLVLLMAGSPTISGRAPVRYVVPAGIEAARCLVIGVQRYFDYGKHDNVRKMVAMYFEKGYPFEPHLSAINTDLCDLRTMRNASAHMTSTTQAALEGLAQRLFSTPQAGIDLYSVLTAVDPRSALGNTVFAEFREKLLVVAGLVANG
ncbi:MAG: hypothetical protein EPN53_15525 [Acidobacteria bacterium]|nr:MAG: hypothetical protein EPN53_15525 [Acidobacteriota bacterium]